METVSPALTILSLDRFLRHLISFSVFISRRDSYFLFFRKYFDKLFLLFYFHSYLNGQFLYFSFSIYEHARGRREEVLILKLLEQFVFFLHFVDFWIAIDRQIAIILSLLYFLLYKSNLFLFSVYEYFFLILSIFCY